MKKITKFEKGSRSNKSTLVAAALVVTAATGFGAYAATDPTNSTSNQTNVTFNQEQLTDEQKAGLEKARAAFQAGDETGAKAILDSLNLEDMEWRFHVGQEMKSEIKDFMLNLTDEQKDGLKEARELFEAGKQDEAKTLLEKLGIQLPEKLEMKLNLTDAQKEALDQARELKKTGDEAGAQKILQEVGIPMPMMHFGFHPMMSEAARTALERGDFEGWKLAISQENSNDPILQEIDEAKFQAMVKVHAAMESGDLKTAKTIAKEAGLKVPELHGPMGGDKMFFKKDLTEEEKIKMEEAHKLMEAGDEDGAKAIFKELGIPAPGKFIMKMELTEDEKVQLKKAKELMNAGKAEEAKVIFDKLGLEPPMKGLVLNRMENLTEEQKAKMEEVHKLMNAGNKEEAKALMNSLNLPKPKDRMMMWLEEDTGQIETK